MDSAPQSAVAEEDVPSAIPTTIDVAVVELRLPCRSFRISYKVAEAGEFSLTTEFLLRLLRLVDGLPETSISQFFGFTEIETSFVIKVVETQGYARRDNGKVHLTQAGHRLFINSEEPALFEVYPKEERFDFDIISFAPADPFRFVDEFELRFPELPLPRDIEGNATPRVFDAFKKYFQEFRLKRAGARLEKEILYTVDAVRPDQRFSVNVLISISVRIDEPDRAEVNLTHWRSGIELEDRAAVVVACADFVRDMKFRSNEVRSQALEDLLDVAPTPLAGFHKAGVFNATSYLRATARQAGELRIDRQTVRVVGQLWTDANRIRFASALRYALDRSGRAPETQFWLRPSTPHWGKTKRLKDILAAVTRQFAERADVAATTIRSVMIGDDRSHSQFKHAFDCVLTVPPTGLPGGLEIFVVPGHLAYVAIHIPIKGDGFPIPFGVLSFDPKLVVRAQSVLKRILSSQGATVRHCTWKSEDLLSEFCSLLSDDFAVAQSGTAEVQGAGAGGGN